MVIIESGGEKITVSRLASMMGISKPSVVELLQRLSSRGYITYERYRLVKLRPKGRKVGVHVYKHHSVLLRFIRDVLGAGEERAEKEACKVEHLLSCDTIMRIQRLIDGRLNLKGTEDVCGSK